MALQNKSWHQHFGQVGNSTAAVCIFAGYSVLSYVNDSLTYWLPDRIQSIGFEKLFHDWVCRILLKMHKKIQDFTDFCYLPISIESSQFLSMQVTFNHLKTNCTKFAHYQLKI